MTEIKAQKTLVCLLAAVAAILLAVWLLPSTVSAASSLQGAGTQEDPYQIWSEGDLRAFQQEVANRNTFAGEYIELKANIDLNGSAESPWTAISDNRDYPFVGDFNGGGYTISGLYCCKGMYQGLFGYLGAGGSIRNLSVSGVVTGSSVNYGNSGGIVGYSLGTVSRCSANVDVTGGSASGGIVGENYSGTVENYWSSGVVKGNGNGSRVGGIVGHNAMGVVKNVYNTGSVSSAFSGSDVGSVIGWAQYAEATTEVTGCYYLEGTAEKSIGYGSHSTYVVESKTSQQFASGEVTWLLNGGVADGTQAFYQTCGSGLPAFTGQTVYQVHSYQCPGDTEGSVIYSNTNENTTGGHSFTSETAEERYLVSPATCTQPAVYYKSCQFCGLASETETFMSGDVNPDNHTEDGTGLHSDGNDHWYICSECGNEFDRTAHSFVWVTDKEASAAEAGSRHQECEVCGYAKDAVEIPATRTAAGTAGPSASAGGEKADSNLVPRTGDGGHAVLWIALMLTAGGASIGAAGSKKRKAIK